MSSIITNSAYGIIPRRGRGSSTPTFPARDYLLASIQGLSNYAGLLPDQRNNIETHTALPGRACDFTGANVSLGTLDLTSSFTISMWVKPTKDSGTSGYFSGASNTVGDGIVIAHAGADFHIFAGTNLDTNVDVPVGEWVQLTLTFDQADSNALTFYVNGQQRYQTSSALTVFSNDYYINRLYTSSTGNRADPILSDLQLFTQALTRSQVEELHLSQESALPEISRLRWFKCDSQHPTLLLDSSGNNGHGTLANHSTATLFYEGRDVPVSYLNRKGYSEDKYRPTGSIVPADWNTDASVVITEASIVVPAGDSNTKLDGYEIDAGRDYHLKFTVSEDDSNFGPRIRGARLGELSGAYSFDGVEQSDNEVATTASGYISTTGTYHYIITLPGSFPDDKGVININRVGTHTGGSTITDLELYPVEETLLPRNEAEPELAIGEGQIPPLADWNIDAKFYKLPNGTYTMSFDESAYRPTITQTRYMDPAGSNSNDGLTPETAWQTFSKGVTAGENTRFICAPGSYANVATWLVDYEIICEDGVATFTGLQFVPQQDCNFYGKNMQFDTLLNSTATGTTIFLENPIFNYTANDATNFDHGIVILKNPSITSGGRDGLDYDNACSVLEINATISDVGTLEADNISTGHGNCRIVSFNCNYQDAPRIVHDVGTTRRDLINCIVKDSSSVSVDPEDSFNVGAGASADTVVTRIFGGDVQGGSVTDLYTDAGSSITVYEDVTYTTSEGNVTDAVFGESEALEFSGEAAHPGQAVQANCATFSGAQEAIDTAVSVTTGMTVSLWIKGDFSSASGSRGILCNRTDVDNNFRIIYTNAGIWTGWSIGGTLFQAVSDTLPEDDVWTRLTIVADGVGDQKIYFNGVQQTTTTNSPGAHNEDNELTIGNRTSNFAQASMADVRIYDRVLTDTEIENNDLAVDDLISWYPLAEGAGDIHWDVIRDTQGSISGHDEAVYFGQTQDSFHYNLKYGSRLVENQFDDSTPSAVSPSAGATSVVLSGDLANYGDIGLDFVANFGATQFGYRACPVQTGNRVQVSAVVQMGDGSEPRLGTSTSDANTDFFFNCSGSVHTPATNPTITTKLLEGTIWKVTVEFDVTNSSGSCGLIQYSGQSDKAFQATALQITLASDPGTYIETEDGGEIKLHRLPAKPDGTWPDATPAALLPVIRNGAYHNLAESRYDMNPVGFPEADHSLPVNLHQTPGLTGMVLESSSETPPTGYQRGQITNGSFDEGIAGWSDESIGSGNISWDGTGAMEFEASTSTNRAYAQQTIEAVIGQSYTITLESDYAGYIRVGSVSDVNSATSYDMLNAIMLSSGTTTHTFTATASTCYVTLHTLSLNGTMVIDNVDIKENLKLVESGSAGAHTLSAEQVTVVGSGKYTAMAFVKAAEKTTIWMLPNSSFFSEPNASIDLTDGSTASDVLVEAQPGGWYKLTYHLTATAGGAAAPFSIAFQETTYTGDGTSGAYVAGMLFCELHHTQYMEAGGYSLPREWHPVDNSGQLNPNFWRRNESDGELVFTDRHDFYSKPLVGAELTAEQTRILTKAV